MKILVTIAHYYNHDGHNSSYGSSRTTPEQRIQSLTECLTALHRLSNNCDFVPADGETSQIARANEKLATQVDVKICVKGNSHLLQGLKVPVSYYRIIQQDVSPIQLTYLCQAVLKDALPEKYDYYCYMDDDIIIRDHYFFQKLQWFTKNVGNEKLLLPRLCELSDDPGMPFKIYLGNIGTNNQFCDFQDWSIERDISLNFLDMPINFVKPCNTYSASFFLNTEQMKKSANSPYFLKGEGAPEVNPTLEKGVMASIERNFQLYKPSIENAAFFEVQHANSLYLKMHMNSFFSNGKFSDIARG